MVIKSHRGARIWQCVDLRNLERTKQSNSVSLYSVLMKPCSFRQDSLVFFETRVLLNINCEFAEFPYTLLRQGFENRESQRL